MTIEDALLLFCSILSCVLIFVVLDYFFEEQQLVSQEDNRKTKHYVANTQGAIAVPVIVTLYQDKVDFINKVPIVPILQFASFVDEFYGNLDEMETIKSNSK